MRMFTGHRIFSTANTSLLQGLCSPLQLRVGEQTGSPQISHHSQVQDLEERPRHRLLVVKKQVQHLHFCDAFISSLLHIYFPFGSFFSILSIPFCRVVETVSIYLMVKCLMDIYVSKSSINLTTVILNTVDSCGRRAFTKHFLFTHEIRYSLYSILYETLEVYLLHFIPTVITLSQPELGLNEKYCHQSTSKCICLLNNGSTHLLTYLSCTVRNSDTNANKCLAISE